MQYPERKALSAARMAHAQECLEAARNLLEAQQFLSASNRLYYAVFHAMRSVLAFDGVDMKHHSGIISEFRKNYIKTGIFDKSLSNTISLAYDMRTGSDYDDFYVVSKQEIADLVEEVEVFLAEILKFIETK